jgi:hypothetical protein
MQRIQCIEYMHDIFCIQIAIAARHNLAIFWLHRPTTSFSKCPLFTHKFSGNYIAQRGEKNSTHDDGGSAHNMLSARPLLT